MKIKILFMFLLIMLTACKDQGEGQSTQGGSTSSSPAVQEEKPIPPTPSSESEHSEEANSLKLDAKKQEINKAFAEIKQYGFFFQDDFELDLRNLMDYRFKIREENGKISQERIELKIEVLRGLVKSLINEFRNQLSAKELEKWEAFLEKTEEQTFVLKALNDTSTYYDYCINLHGQSEAIKHSMRLIRESLQLSPFASCIDKEKKLQEAVSIVLINLEGAIDLSPLRGLYKGKLEHLKIERYWLSTGNNLLDLKPLKYLVNLKKLELKNWSLNNEDTLGNLASLVSLEIPAIQLKDYRLLHELTILKTLNISRSKIEEIKFLDRMSNLTKLYLAKNNIKDITPLKHLLNLEVLDLENNQITHIEALNVGHSKLHSLLLGGNLIKDLSSLNQLSNLKSLQLIPNDILADSLHCPRDSHITDLNNYCKDLIERGPENRGN